MRRFKVRDERLIYDTFVIAQFYQVGDARGGIEISVSRKRPKNRE
jgi:hypothetical protein